MNSYKTGLFSEWVARMYLRMHGFRIRAARYTTGKNTGRAEIDIIAQRGGLIVFVEVKCRPTYDAAWDAISPHQTARLRRAAETYLGRIRWRGNARFDTIFICRGRIYWEQNSI